MPEFLSFSAANAAADAGSPGEAAYRGYFAKCEGKSLVSGAPLPLWNDQAPEIRDAWEAAADAVLAL